MNKFESDIWKDGGVGHYTNQNDMYLEYISNELSFIDGKVLEIGPGSGIFALNKYSLTEYHVLDLEKNIMDSVNYLKNNGFNNINYTFSQNYRDLFSKKFELIVSNVVIPETPKEYREDLLNNIIPNTNKAIIIGQFPDIEYENWILNLFNNNFNLVTQKMTKYKNCWALIGEKNENRIIFSWK
jgi:ribosomal protein L11 methylase PrmA